MYLKQLEIQGFKSFARKTVLEFEPGVISVVGPNGSGKSNFADAIRWVLGEQSMKAIRSKKSEDVIFAGSDKKSKLGMAEVAITFDNQDRSLPVDFSEVVFTRRLYRDGTSEYLINKRQVRLMDISELLSKSGYGGYSYHIISQGTIDQLVISGPAAIKQLIEEASGVKPFYLKRERSMRKLERTEENLRRVADLVAEIEPRLRSLRRQTKRFEQREELAGELRNLRRQFFAARFHEYSGQREDFKKQIKDFDKKIEELLKKSEEKSKILRTNESDTNQQGEAYKKLQQDLHDLERKKAGLQEQIATLRGQLKANVPVVGQDPALLALRKRELTQKITEIKNQLQYLSEGEALGKKNLTDHQKIAQKFEQEVSVLKKKLESASHPFNPGSLKADIERIYSKFQSLLYSIKHWEREDDRKVMAQDAENFELAIVKLKDKIAQYADTNVDYDNVSQLTEQLDRIFEKREELQKQIGEIKAELASSISKKKFYEQQLEELGGELNRVVAAESQGNAETRDDAIKDLMQTEKDFSDRLSKLSAEIEIAEKALREYLQQEQKQKQQLFEVEREYRTTADELSKLKDRRGLVLIESARVEANVESILSDARSVLGEAAVKEVENSKNQAVEPGLEHKISKLKAQIEGIGGIDDLTLQEYRETDERYKHLTEQSADLNKAVNDLKAIVTELDNVIKKQFTSGFEKINARFAEFFRILFSGGRANMSLVKQILTTREDGEVEPTEENEELARSGVASGGKQEVTGVEVRAVPPGKKLSSLAALSGGERTMTAIALLTAILASFPSPFVVLDEVDAALDEANSIRFATILGKLTAKTQFITITHNRETMRQAGMIYGVTMGEDGISKVLSIKLDKAVEIAE